MYLSKEFEIENDDGEKWFVEVEAYVYWTTYGDDADGRRGTKVLEMEKKTISSVHGPELDEKGQEWLAREVDKAVDKFDWTEMMN